MHILLDDGEKVKRLQLVGNCEDLGFAKSPINRISDEINPPNCDILLVVIN
jgi:hypothetical protein